MVQGTTSSEAKCDIQVHQKQNHVLCFEEWKKNKCDKSAPECTTIISVLKIGKRRSAIKVHQSAQPQSLFWRLGWGEVRPKHTRTHNRSLCYKEWEEELVPARYRRYTHLILTSSYLRPADNRHQRIRASRSEREHSNNTRFALAKISRYLWRNQRCICTRYLSQAVAWSNKSQDHTLASHVLIKPFPIPWPVSSQACNPPDLYRLLFFCGGGLT